MAAAAEPWRGSGESAARKLRRDLLRRAGLPQTDTTTAGELIARFALHRHPERMAEIFGE